MSITLSRHIFKALVGRSVVSHMRHPTRMYRRFRDALFHKPYCLFDFVDLYDKRHPPKARTPGKSALRKITNGNYKLVLVLGKPAREGLDRQALSITVIPLGFPIGNNEDRNIGQIEEVLRTHQWLEKDLRQTLERI